MRLRSGYFIGYFICSLCLLVALPAAVAEPVVTGVDGTDGTYGVGDTFTLTITFSEAVTVNGTPQLEIELGATDQTADYASGNGTDTLTFTYTVATGDAAAELDYTNINALMLNSGAIEGALLNDTATLTLVLPGNAGSLNANSNIVVDGVAPTIVIDTPADNSISGNVTPVLSITLVDAQSALVNYTLRIDGVLAQTNQTAPGTLEINLTALGDGTYTLLVTVIDVGGNTDTDSVTVSIDAAPPTVSITAPLDGISTSDNTPSLTVTLGDSVSANVSYRVIVDGSETQNGGENIGVGRIITLGALADGSHNVTVNITDEGGFTAADSISLTVDTAAPSVTITSPANAFATNDTTPQLTLTFTDGQATNVSYRVYVDNSLVQNGGGPVGAGYLVNLSALADGVHTVRVNVSDNVGLQASNVITLTTDSTAPTVSISAPSNAAVIAVNNTTVVFTPLDAVSVSIDYRLFVDGLVASSATATNNTATGVPVTGLTVGAHSYQVEVADGLNNRRNSSVRTLTVDLDAPSIVINSPATGIFTNATVALSFTITDDSTTLLPFSFMLDGAFNSSGVATNGTQYILNLTSLAAGTRALRINGTDGSNTAFSDNITITADYTAPTQSAFIVTSESSDGYVLNITTNEIAECRYGVSNTSYGAKTAFAVTNTSAHTVTLSGLTASTTIEYGAHCKDRAGNVAYVELGLNATTDAAPSSGGGGRGGGGGGGGIVTPAAPGALTINRTISASASGSKPSVVIGIGGLQSLSFVFEQATPEVPVSVKVLQPEDVAKPFSDAMIYYDISFGKPTAFKEATLTITVQKLWLSARKLTFEDLAVVHFSDGAWRELPVVQTSENMNSVTIAATTPGFSAFAVIPKKLLAEMMSKKQAGAVNESLPAVPNTLLIPARADNGSSGIVALPNDSSSWTDPSGVSFAASLVVIVALIVGVALLLVHYYGHGSNK